MLQKEQDRALRGIKSSGYNHHQPNRQQLDSSSTPGCFCHCFLSNNKQQHHQGDSGFRAFSDHSSKSASKFCDICEYWPVVLNNYLIVHLCNISWEKLHNGDTYFFIRKKPVSSRDRSLCKGVELWVRQCSIGGARSELPVLDIGTIFTMSWGEDRELEATLRRCLVSLEESVCRLRWQDLTPAGDKRNTDVNQNAPNFHHVTYEPQRKGMY